MDDITQIRVGGTKVGLLGLPEIFEQVRGETPTSDEAAAERLVELVSRPNYVAPGKRAAYAAALFREYRKFLGEEVPAEAAGGLEIRVLGPGCPNCERLMREVREVLQEGGINADLEHVRDLREIATYGPVATPVLVINGKIVAGGRVPPKDKLTRLIRECIE